MNRILKSGLAASAVCAALTLGACATDGYYGGGGYYGGYYGYPYAYPYAYPSSGASFYYYSPRYYRYHPRYRYYGRGYRGHYRYRGHGYYGRPGYHRPARPQHRAPIGTHRPHAGHRR